MSIVTPSDRATGRRNGSSLLSTVKQQQTKILDAIPRTEELISVEDFLSLSDADRSAFKAISIVPPTLGQKGFGKMLVVRKSPIYEFHRE